MPPRSWTCTEHYYGLSGSPFQLTPDPRFFYGSRGHSRAIAHLTYGLAQGEGFIIVTGEVGAGKTTLIERLLCQIDHDTYAVARINTTQVSGEDLFHLAMAGFGMNEPDATKATLLLRFEEMLRYYLTVDRRCLLIVDEVQNLSLAALEELRMLSNITEDGRVSLQTILMGQPNFRRMLVSPDFDQLRQRVLASCHLGPLQAEETRAYIEHRLVTVGWRGLPGWDDAAFAAAHVYSGGIPRRINRLCARVLLFAALERSTEVTAAMVGGTADELMEDIEGASAKQIARVSASCGAQHATMESEHRSTFELLSRRVQALEEQLARHEALLQSVLDGMAADIGAAR